MAFVPGPALPSPRAARATPRCTVRMAAPPPPPSSDNAMSRRALLAAAVATAVGASLPASVLADREYANVGFLGGGDVIDVNNANVRAYQKIKGFYPSIAGLLVSNGPYSSVDDVLKISGLTQEQVKIIQANKEKLVALPPAPEYVIDKINNGLYR